MLVFASTVAASDRMNKFLKFLQVSLQLLQKFLGKAVFLVKYFDYYNFTLGSTRTSVSYWQVSQWQIHKYQNQNERNLYSDDLNRNVQEVIANHKCQVKCVKKTLVKIVNYFHQDALTMEIMFLHVFNVFNHSYAAIGK